MSKNFDIVILDKIRIIIETDVVDIKKMVKHIENKPPIVEFILTGYQKTHLKII